jgi:CheY-like chemotaxis protein
MKNRKNILIVDKDNVFLHALKKDLAAHADFYQVAFATHSAQALTIIKKFVVHLMVININLSGESGINLLFQVRRTYPHIRVVLYTDVDIHEEYKRTLLYGGASAVLQKPFHAADLVKIADKFYRENKPSALPDFVKLMDVLQMLASENNSVCLEVTVPASKLAGIITVQNGYLVTAIAPDGRTGVDALAQILTWKESAIMASKLPPPVDDQVTGIPLNQAILQATVRLHETDS